MNEIFEGAKITGVEQKHQRKRRAKQGGQTVQSAKASAQEGKGRTKGARFRISQEQMDALRRGRSA